MKKRLGRYDWEDELKMKEDEEDLEMKEGEITKLFI